MNIINIVYEKAERTPISNVAQYKIDLRDKVVDRVYLLVDMKENHPVSDRWFSTSPEKLGLIYHVEYKIDGESESDIILAPQGVHYEKIICLQQTNLTPTTKVGTKYRVPILSVKKNSISEILVSVTKNVDSEAEVYAELELLGEREVPLE